MSLSINKNQTALLIQAGLTSTIAILLTACLSVTQTPSSTPTPTPSKTPTQPFPTLAPTITATPIPSLTPTLELVSGVGEELYRDSFDWNTGWEIGSRRYGAVSLFEGRLVISVNTPGTTIIAESPGPNLRDFYAEVNLKSNICSNADEYGLIFRKTPELDHYRFTITCDGGARFSRVVNGTEMGIVPITETFSVFPGSPAENSLAVWVEGDQFRFFINDLQVFEAKDPIIPTGGLGLLVRSRQGGQTTISFEDLLAREIVPKNTPSPTAGSP